MEYYIMIAIYRCRTFHNYVARLHVATQDAYFIN